MGVNGKEAYAGRINTGYNEVSADVALILEQVLLEHCHAGNDPRFTTRRKGVEFQVRGNDGSGEFRICGCAGAGAPDLGSNVM